MIKPLKRIIAFFIAMVTIISFSGCDEDTKPKKVDNFKVTTYIRGDYIQSADSLYEEDFDIVTHVILFECASFDNKGNEFMKKKNSKLHLQISAKQPVKETYTFRLTC